MNTKERFEAIAQRMREAAEPDDFGDPVSDGEIQEAEEELGVTFPESYKLLLREFGFAYWPTEICGLGERCAPGYEIVFATERERTKAEPKMPLRLLPFAPDGAGNHDCFDTSRLVEGECPVVFWNHELDQDQEPVITHPSFLDWLEEQIQWRIEDDENEG